MPAHRIIASPKRQAILALIVLHHKIVGLSSPLICKMLAPDKIAFPVKYHGTRPWKTPAFWREEIVRAVVASFIPLQPVDLGRGDVALRGEGRGWVVAECAVVECVGWALEAIG
jgi:hypothetical protein